MLALGVAGHALISRVVKAVLWSWSPLATGEQEVATYDRRVYHTADVLMLQILGVASVGGLLFWLGLWLGGAVWGVLGVLVVLGSVALDVLRWERVASSGNNLWFQRGYGQRVHQVALDNIRDLSVEETEAGGFTLRHGRHNRLVRLQVRLNDKRVVALPKTDAHTGLDAVESVANHLRGRLDQMRERDRDRGTNGRSHAAARAAADGPPRLKPLAAEDGDLEKALRRLRHPGTGEKAPRRSKTGSSR